MDEVTENFPEYQATWMKGEVNFTVRKADPKEAVDGLKHMIKEWESWVGSAGLKSAQKPSKASRNDETVGECPMCHSNLVYFSGKSKKTGKPFEAHKCSNEKCDYIKWL